MQMWRKQENHYYFLFYKQEKQNTERVADFCQTEDMARAEARAIPGPSKAWFWTIYTAQAPVRAVTEGAGFEQSSIQRII